MQLNELRPTLGSRKDTRRIGRGNGSGMGGTATKGHKGQKARTGRMGKRGFEGGQMPLVRRLPKFGFTSLNRQVTRVVNLDQLTDWPSGEPVTAESLVAKGIIRKRFGRVKLLGRGTAPKQLTVQLEFVSVTARTKIEAAGWSIASTTK